MPFVATAAAPIGPTLLFACADEQKREALTQALSLAFEVRAVATINDALFELTEGAPAMLVATGGFPDGDAEILLTIAAEVAPEVRRVLVAASLDVPSRGAADLVLRDDVDEARLVVAAERLLLRPRSSEAKRLRVLVVDADRLLRAATSRLLASQCEVDVASSRAETLLALEATSFDVVVCDAALACESGTELLRELRVKHPRVGRVLISSATRGAEIVAGLDDGTVQVFVPKPLTPQSLHPAVLEASGRATSSRPGPLSNPAVYCDDRDFPLLCVFVWRVPTDAEWQACLADVLERASSRGQYALVVVERTTSPSQEAERRRQLDSMEAQFGQKEPNCVALAHVLSSRLDRAVQRVSMVVRKGRTRQRTFATLEEGRAWALGIVEAYTAATVRPEL